MTNSTIRKNKKHISALPFLARFSLRLSSQESANEDNNQKHCTIVTEVDRETTDEH